jgi:hypothetical protein
MAVACSVLQQLVIHNHEEHIPHASYVPRYQIQVLKRLLNTALMIASLR